MGRLSKLAATALTGGLMFQTIVCNVPDVAIVTDRYYDEYVIVDDYGYDYYYSDYFYWW